MKRRTFLTGLGTAASISLAGCEAPEEGETTVQTTPATTDSAPDRPVDLNGGYDSQKEYDGGVWEDTDIVNNVTVNVGVDRDNASYTFDIDFRDTGLRFYEDCRDDAMAGVYAAAENETHQLAALSRPTMGEDDPFAVAEYLFFDELRSTANHVHDIVIDHNSQNLPDDIYDINVSDEEQAAIWRYGADAASYNLTIHGDDGGSIAYHVPKGVIPDASPWGDDPDAAQETLDTWSDILSSPVDIRCGSREAPETTATTAAE